jgi:uncharacterized protein YaiE (UPF0345 family)
VLCNGATTQAVVFSGSVAGTVYNWTIDLPVIGFSTSGSGNLIAVPVFNPTLAPIVATITVTPSANGCTGTPVSFTITVNPTPLVVPPANQSVCNGAPTAAVTFNSLVAGSTFSWTNNTPSIGLAANGTGNIGTFNAINTGTTPVVATITVTPSANGCTGIPVSFTITVRPTPVVTQPANQIVCHNTPVTAVTFSGAVAGTTYSWTNNRPSIGLAASGNGNIASFTATNSTNTPVVATITVTPSANGCTGTPRTFTITVNPLPVPTITGTSTVCVGSAEVTYSTQPGMTGYFWTVSAGGSITSGANTNQIHVAWSTTGPKTVSVNYTNGNGCTAALASNFAVTVNPRPVPTISGVTSVCEGTPGVTYSTQPGMTGYTWSVSAGGTITAGASSSQITVTWNTPGARSVSVNYTNSNGCSAENASTYAVTVVANPVSGTLTSSTADSYVCEGATLNAVATNGTGGAGNITDVLQYRYDGGSWQPYTSGTNLNSIGHGNVEVRTYRTADGLAACSMSEPVSIIWYIHEVPATGTLTPSPAAGNICEGTPVSVTAGEGSGGAGWMADYVEYRIDGGNWNDYAAGTNLSTAGISTVDIRTYRVSSGAGCTTSAPLSVSWTVIPAPVSGTLTPSVAAGSVCEGMNVSATSVAGFGGVGVITDVLHYRFDGSDIWNTYTSGTILNTTGHTSVEIETYRTATGSGACSKSSPVSVIWTISKAPVSGSLSAIPAAGAVCDGAMLSATATAGTGGAGSIADVLQYRFDNGGWNTYTSGTSLNTAGHTTVDIQTFRTASGPGCTASAAKLASWTVNSATHSGSFTPTPSAGPVCEGTVLSALVNGGQGGAGTITDVAQYRYDGGTWVDYSAGSNLVTTGHTTVELITYRTANGAGCASSAPVKVLWTVNALPQPTIVGSALQCVEAGEVIYTTDAGMTGYTWNAGIGGTITGGAGTNQIKVDWTTAGMHTVSVNFSDENLCRAATETILPVLVQEGLPSVVGSINGSVELCAGATNVLYTVSSDANTISYNWTLPDNAILVAGGGTDSIYVDFSALPATSIIKVNGVNACGEGATSPDYLITTVIAPEAAVITQDGDLLISSAPNDNQWYFNSEPLDGATENTLVPVVSGTYFTVVTSHGCSSGPSNSVIVYVTGIPDVDFERIFEVYPNPSNGLFMLHVTSNKRIVCDLKVYNSAGSLVWKHDRIEIDGDFKTQIDLQDNLPGNYTVILSNDNGKATRKMIIQQ